MSGQSKCMIGYCDKSEKKDEGTFDTIIVHVNFVNNNEGLSQVFDQQGG